MIPPPQDPYMDALDLLMLKTRILTALDLACGSSVCVLTTRDLSTVLNVPLEQLPTVLEEMREQKLIERRVVSLTDSLYGLEWRRCPK